MAEDFSDLKAIFLNCSIKYDAASSHTRRLMARSAGIMDSRGGRRLRAPARTRHRVRHGHRRHRARSRNATTGPRLHQRIMEADILVMGTPIWAR